jgi:uncharacterized membrane protein
MTPKTREAIYTSVAGIVPVLIASGFLTDELGKAILGLVSAGLTVFALVVAKKHVPK